MSLLTRRSAVDDAEVHAELDVTHRAAVPASAGEKARERRGESRGGRTRRGKGSRGKGRRGKGSGGEVAPAMHWTRGAALSATGARVLIVGALVCGPLAVAMQWTAGPARVPASVSSGSDAAAGARVAAGEWAQSFVMAWLTTSSDDAASLDYYLPAGSSADVRLQRVPRQAANPAVAAIGEVSLGGLTGTSPGTGSAGTASSARASAGGSASASGTSSAGASVPTSSASSAGSASGSSSALGSTVWSVTVGVDVQEPVPQSSASASAASAGAVTPMQTVRRYFAVSVWQGPGEGSGQGGAQGQAGLRALTLPAPVAAPTAGDPDALDYVDDLSLSGGVGSSVSGFLTAYLTGTSEDLTRWLAPELTLTPVLPVAYSGVQLEDLATVSKDGVLDKPVDGDVVQVLATVDLTGLDGQTSTAQYALTLAGRGGRWEVAHLDPAPRLQAPASASTAAADATSSTSSTTQGSTPPSTTDAAAASAG